MAKKVIPIDYTSTDFEKIKKDLVNYAKKYYPETYKDFNEASFGSLMTDLVAYVGDSLSFYLDYNANESFLNTSLEYDNVLNHAQQLGYKHNPYKSSVGEVEIFIPIPSDDSNVAPDTRYMPRIARGTSFATPAGNVFTLIDDIELYNSGAQVIASQVSSDGSKVTFYTVKATGRVTSGEDLQTIVEVEDYKRFLKVLVPGSNITEITSVVDSEGNEYFEVDHLSQNTVYKPIMSRVTDENIIDPSAPAVMRAVPVPRRFVVERTSDSVYIVFGYGSEDEIKDNLVADPSDVVLDIAGKNYVSDATFDPSKLMSTDKFGVTPVNTSLTITYRTNTIQNVNAAAGTVTKVLTPNLEFRDVQDLEEAKVNYILSNIEVNNPAPINGDITSPTTEEIKRRAQATFAMQGRAVTLQDYISATYAMPSNFGAVKRAVIYRDADDYRRNMNLYIIGEDRNGKLQACSSAVKDNLKTWLNSVRMVNDSLDIFNAAVINIGIEFTALCPRDVNKNAVFNQAKEEIYKQLNEVKPEIGEAFSITEIFKILRSVDEILDVSDIKITAKSSVSHSSYEYDMDNNLSVDGRMIHIPQNCIWELKYKNDITGTII
jgi:hypothetical protein